MWKTIGMSWTNEDRIDEFALSLAFPVVVSVAVVVFTGVTIDVCFWVVETKFSVVVLNMKSVVVIPWDVVSEAVVVVFEGK